MLQKYRSLKRLKKIKIQFFLKDDVSCRVTLYQHSVAPLTIEHSHNFAWSRHHWLPRVKGPHHDFDKGKRVLPQGYAKICHINKIIWFCRAVSDIEVYGDRWHPLGPNPRLTIHSINSGGMPKEGTSLTLATWLTSLTLASYSQGKNEQRHRHAHQSASIVNVVSQLPMLSSDRWNRSPRQGQILKISCSSWS